MYSIKSSSSCQFLLCFYPLELLDLSSSQSWCWHWTFHLTSCTEYHDTVGPNFSTRNFTPWMQPFWGCSAASHFSTFCLNTSKYSILHKCILCRWLYHIYGWGSVHCIVDAPDTVSSAWLLVTLKPGPLLRHSGQQECVWHLPWSEGGSRPADQQTSTSPGYSTQHTFIVLKNLQSASPVYCDICG